MSQKQVYLGLDVGGTNIAGALVDEKGQILARQKLPTWARDGKDAIIGQMVQVINHLYQPGPTKGLAIAGIGMGIPGPVLVQEGLSLHSPNLFWDNVPIRDIIQKHYPLPVVMDNDVRCAAIGEKYFGAGRGVKDVICITLGTGVGSGIFINDQLFRGYRDIAGEIGHMTMNPAGPQCNCGNRGCLEAYVGAPSIARRAREAIKSGQNSLVSELVAGDMERITAATVSQAAVRGDHLARQIMQETAELIGLALANVVNMFNPQLIIIGGGVARAGEMLLKPIRETVKARAMREHAKMVEVVAAQLGEDAGMIGAAWLVRLTKMN